jgi:hypothetical protein
MSEQSPFVPGARVAIPVGNPYSVLSYEEDFVYKVHKSGRFTLKGSPTRQWKPFGSTAIATGDFGWSSPRPTLRIWDDASNAEIMEAIRRSRRYHKFKELRDQLSQVQFSDLVTDEVLDQLQIVVLAVKPIK